MERFQLLLVGKLLEDRLVYLPNELQIIRRSN